MIAGIEREIYIYRERVRIRERGRDTSVQLGKEAATICTNQVFSL